MYKCALFLSCVSSQGRGERSLRFWQQLDSFSQFQRQMPNDFCHGCILGCDVKMDSEALTISFLLVIFPCGFSPFSFFLWSSQIAILRFVTPIACYSYLAGSLCTPLQRVCPLTSPVASSHTLAAYDCALHVADQKKLQIVLSPATLSASCFCYQPEIVKINSRLSSYGVFKM